MPAATGIPHVFKSSLVLSHSLLLSFPMLSCFVNVTMLVFCIFMPERNIGETLGIEVQPSDVRLRSEEDMPYKWQIDDPALEPLFQKHLSKHSVRAYMLLQRGVG
jgi:hypothetical protein